jgi:PAS domain S-box-containing protein
LNVSEPLFTDPVYKILFDSIEEGFIIVDQSGAIVLANPRTCKLFGYEEGGVIGMKVEDLIPANLRKRHKVIRTDFHQSPKKRSMGAGMNLKALRKDGSTFYVEISLNPIKVQETTFVSALITDVSERVAHEKEIKELNSDLEEKVKLRTKEVRESQELYSAIARNFPNGTINVFDRDLNYIFVEGKELFQLGITSEKLIGTNYLEKIAEEIRPKIKIALLSVFKGETQDFEIEFKGQNYRINAVPLSFDSDQIDRILVVEKNITPQKQIIIQQNAALVKEKRLNEMKSRFVSMASHEFRTPLSTILSSTALIDKYIEKELYDKTGKHTDRIKKSVHGLTEILNDFLSVDKLETQITPVKIQSFNYEQLSKDMVEEMGTITKDGQIITCELIGDDFNISSDPNIIKNILYNLISNAIKYSGENQPILYRSEILDNNLHIFVRDKGIGIPKQDQEQLFTRFFRANNVTNIKGTGLGLNIVQKYLEMLNGKLTFESEENKETTFYITIPINLNSTNGN